PWPILLVLPERMVGRRPALAKRPLREPGGRSGSHDAFRSPRRTHARVRRADGTSAVRGAADGCGKFAALELLSGNAMCTIRLPAASAATKRAAAAGFALSILPAAGIAHAALARSGSMPPPEDEPYPGTIAIHVDASDTSQGIFRVHETIPVQPGELTLLYPEWIPGNHSPSGPVSMLAGLVIRAGGEPLAWTRDEYDVYAFHVDVPSDVTRLEVDFQYLSGRGEDATIEMTDRMLDLVW